MKQYQEKKECSSGKKINRVYRDILFSFTALCLIACQQKSFGNVGSGISSMAVDKIKDSLILHRLMNEIEQDNFDYLVDTIWGECLIFHYELEFIDKDGYLNYPSFLTKKQIKDDISKYHSFLEGKSIRSNSVKEVLLQKIKSVEIPISSEFAVSVPVGDGEFDSSCLFHFSVIGQKIYLTSIKGN